MRIISYSDLHLEFQSGWAIPTSIDADLMILAGDIITFKDYSPLAKFLVNWSKPVLYIAGNHEYYTRTPWNEEKSMFKQWLTAYHPNVTLLCDEAIIIDGVHFFGGTMWTDFNGGDMQAMEIAAYQLNDFRMIKNPDFSPFEPSNTLQLHERFEKKLLKWLETDLLGPRVVISHHVPVIKPCTKFPNSPLTPAFNSLDMMDIINKYQPALWIYGHTHECDDHQIGKTRIISNQRGYPSRKGGFECADFDEYGKLVEVL